jgi:hypothetical protein
MEPMTTNRPHDFITPIQRTLSPERESLSSTIRCHYDLLPQSETRPEVDVVMQVDFSAVGKLVIMACRLLNLLTAYRGREILVWWRTFEHSGEFSYSLRREALDASPKDLSSKTV